MRRRVHFLRSQSDPAQRNRVARISEALHKAGWVVSAGPKMTLDRYDILWVVDPKHACRIGDTQFRLLVWDRNLTITNRDEDQELAAAAGSFILKHCAHVTINDGGDVETNYRDLERDSLAYVLAEELAEDVITALKGIQEVE